MKISNFKFQISNYQGGQALITLLVFSVMASIIIAGAVAITLVNSRATGKLADSEDALKVAEAGADNAVMRLVRNPGYTGETLTVGTGTATITVDGSAKTITSTGVSGNFQRVIQVGFDNANNAVSVSSWQEL